MRKFAGIALLWPLVLLWGCTHTELVQVPPRLDLRTYGTLGIVEFASNADAAISAHATRQFQEQVQSAQPGTRFVNLGSRETVLAAVGGRQLDVESLKKIGEKYGVDAVFAGDIVYSDPKTDIKIKDLTRLDGSVHTEVRGDISSSLMETRTGASVWSSSAWAKRQIGRLSVSAEQGVSGGMSNEDPRDEMVQSLVYYLTQDFRPTSVRQRVK